MKIDKEIPIPVNRRANYDFASMEVGDSFLAKHASVRTSASLHAKKSGRKYTVQKRTFAKHNEAGWRVWRTA